MFNLGAWGEGLIIAITALLVLKPEDFPKMMRQLSRWILVLRRYKYQLQTHYLEVLHAAEREEILERDQHHDAS